MPISVRCPTCGKDYRVRDELSGKEAKCRCGQKLVIPAVAVMATLLDEEILAPPPEPDSPPPASSSPLAAQRRAGWWRRRSRAPFGAGLGKKAARRKGFHPATLAIVLLGAVGAMVIGTVILVLESIDPMAKPFVPSLPSTPPRRVRWATPQAVFDAQVKAFRERDWRTAYETVTPDDQREAASGTVMVAVWMTEVEGDSEFRAVCEKHGIDTAEFKGLALLRSPRTAKAESQVKAEASRMAERLTDKAGFVADTLRVMFKRDARLQATMPFMSIVDTRLSNVVITGESASGSRTMAAFGRSETSPIHFRKVDGEWRVDESGGEAGILSRPRLPTGRGSR